jgi:drug/metabolite transporter (DMT)-like permease
LSRPVLLGSALVAGAAALFGTLSFVTRSAAELGMDALPFVAWRAVIGASALVILGALAAGASQARLPDPRSMARDRQVALLLACLCGAALNVAMFAAFLRTTIAVVLICFYTFPAIVTLAAIRLYGERLEGARLVALAMSSVGLVLVVLGPALAGGELEVDAIGVALALFAAVCQAAFILIAGRGFRPLPSLQVGTLVVASAGIVSVVLIVLVGDLPGLLLPASEPRTWIWILAGGLAGAAIPTTALLVGIGLIGPSRAAILMTVEPLVGVLLAGLLLGEQPVPLQLIGGAAVLTAAIVLQLGPPAARRPEPEVGQLV